MMNYYNVMPQPRFEGTLDPKKADQIVELARAAQTLLHKDIAEIVGVSRNAVSMILRGAAEEEAEEYRERITDYRAEHPEATDAEVVNHFGLLSGTIQRLTGPSKSLPGQPERGLFFGTIGAELSDEIIKWGMAFPDATYKEIADIVGEELGRTVSISLVAKLLKTAGRKLPGPGLHTKVPHEEVVAYVRQHPEIGYEAVGKHFGYSKYYIGTIASKAGIKPGPQDTFKFRTSIHEEVADYVRQHPEMSYKAIGRHFDYTAAMIRYIVKKFAQDPPTRWWKSGKWSRETPQPYRNPQPSWNLARHRWE